MTLYTYPLTNERDAEAAFSAEVLRQVPGLATMSQDARLKAAVAELYAALRGVSGALRIGLGVATPSEAVLVSGIDVAAASVFVPAALTAGRLVGAPLNPPAAGSQRIVITIVQDGTGGRAVTWNAVFKLTWSDTGNTAGKRSSIAFVWDGTNWNQDGAQTPYV